MKQTLRIIVLLAVALTVSSQAFAQRGRKEPGNREKLAKVQAHHIARKLAFDDATTQNFVSLYCQCQQDIWKLCPKAEKKPKGTPKSDKKTEADIDARFNRGMKILNIRREYYRKYSAFLTPKQIDRVYKMERKMMNSLANSRRQHQRRK